MNQKLRVLLLVKFVLFTCVVQAQPLYFEWAKQLHSSFASVGTNIHYDEVSHHVYTVGYFLDTTYFDPGNRAQPHTTLNHYNGFVLKTDLNGNFVWIKTLNGFDYNSANAVTTDIDKNVIVAGEYKGILTFNSIANSYASNGVIDGFVAKYNEHGTFLWSYTFGGNWVDEVHAVVTNKNGEVYLTGYFSDTVDFDPSPNVNIQTGVNAGQDAFVAKLSASGQLIWVKVFGGEYTDDYGASIALDRYENIIISGQFNGTCDFNPDAGSYNLFTQNRAAFVLKLTPQGNFIWARSLDSRGFDYGRSVATDAYNNIHVAGHFADTLYFKSNTTSTLINTCNGQYDAFLTKLDENGNLLWGKTFGGYKLDYALDLQTDDAGNSFVIGNFEESIDLDPGIGVSFTTSNGKRDIYISKFNSQGDFEWTKTIGGSGTEFGSAIAVSDNGDLYATGSFEQSVDFNPSQGVHILTNTGLKEAFLLKFNKINIGVNEDELFNQVSVYPNPTTDWVTIQMPLQKEYDFWVYNSMGQIVETKSEVSLALNQVKLPAAAGLYYIEILREGKSKTFKIIKTE